MLQERKPIDLALIAKKSLAELRIIPTQIQKMGEKPNALSTIKRNDQSIVSNPRLG